MDSPLLSSRTKSVYADLMSCSTAIINSRLHAEDATVHRATSVADMSNGIDAACLQRGLGSAEAMLAELGEIYAREAVDYTSPRYAAHLNPPVLLASLAAEAMATALNTAVESFDQARSAALIEQRLVNQICHWCGFDQGDGVFTPGGTASNIQALYMALQRFRHGAGESALETELRVYCSSDAHYSLIKGARLVGLGASAVVTVGGVGGRLDPEALESAIRADQGRGCVPVMIVATLGTTDRGALDPLQECAALAATYGAWMHVDAAVGGALILPREVPAATDAAALAGLRAADSVTIDFHKTFYVPVGCSGIFVRNADAMAYVTEHADYLNPRDCSRPHLANKSLQTTRRFDAVKLWAALRTHGASRIAALFDGAREVTALAFEILDACPDIEVLERPSLVTVLFRLRSLEDRAGALSHVALRHYLADAGRTHVASTRVEGAVWLKLTLLNPEMTRADLRAIVADIRAGARELRESRAGEAYRASSGGAARDNRAHVSSNHAKVRV